MPANGKEDDCRLGFLTTIEVPKVGYVGGLLVTNRFGRPLEFQCTSPVSPNRTQEILYGPTLLPFVLGELIGRTLIEKVGVKPHLLLTKQAEVLEVRNHISMPVAYLDSEIPSSNSDSSEAGETHAASESLPNVDSATDSTVAEKGETTTAVGPSAEQSGRHGRILRFHSAHESDRASVESMVDAITHDLDLHEPFERVREALEETIRSGAAR